MIGDGGPGQRRAGTRSTTRCHGGRGRRVVTFDPSSATTPIDDGDGPSSVTVTGAPARTGRRRWTGDGQVTYTPGPDFNGTDSFTYQVCDGTGGADTATVTVTVDPVNDAPDAVDDSDTVDEDSSGDRGRAGQRHDVDDGLDPASVTVTSRPGNGSTSVNPRRQPRPTPPTPTSPAPTPSPTRSATRAGACDTAPSRSPSTR